jgi:hypothetical protein
MDAPASQPYDWLHFAARSGAAGARWAAKYRRHGTTVMLCDEALRHFRQRRPEDGREALREYERAIRAEGAVPRSMRGVFRRWYHGVAAFERYCAGEFDDAAAEMERAHEAVVDAVSRDGFLLMLTVHCQEFRLHHARIARNRLRWDELDAHVRHARAMTTDEIPLCRLHGGEPVYFASVGGFIGSVPDPAPAERSAAGEMLDEARRLSLFERFVHRLYTPPDLAIQYP